MPVDRRALGALFLGGVVGTLARAGLAEAISHRTGDWPWQTFAANMLAAFLLGVFAARLREPSHERLFLTTGVCGALSTFSTFQLELLRMLDGGRAGLALAYAGASLAAGFAVMIAGARVGEA